MSKNSKSIAFWGAEAPPYGGMAVHIQRLSSHLQNKNWAITQYNFKKDRRNKYYIKNINNLLFWYLSLWFKKSPNIHYIITTRAKIRFLGSLLRLRGKKVIIRVGGQSMENELNNGRLPKYLNIISLKFCSAFIGVNRDICSLAKNYTTSEKIKHIPGFIPPQLEEKTAPKLIRDFFQKEKLKLVATGQLFDQSEPDIYGLYHFADTLKLLKHKSLNFKAVIVIYGNSKPNFEFNLNHIKKYIGELGIENDTLIYVNNGELWPIIKESNVFVRSSITDGDANAIREALFFNKQVIASDCVSRPNPCILYKSEDSKKLAEKIERIDLNRTFKNNEIGNHHKIEKLLLNLIRK